MKRIYPGLIFALFVFISPLTTFAVTRYVNNDTGCAGCSDSCTASTAQTLTTACDTINKCISFMAAGDRCEVRAVGNGGTYVEHLHDTTLHCATCALIPNGTSRATATTIAAYAGESPVLNPGVLASAASVIRHRKTDVPRQFIIYDGLTVDMVNSATGSTMHYGVIVQSGSSIDFQNGVIKNSDLTSTTPTNAVLISNFNPPAGNPDPTDIRMINNSIRDVGDGFGTTTALGHGVYVGTSGNIIERNAFLNISGYCVHVFASATTGPPRREPSNNIVRQNSCVNNGRFGTTSSAGIIVGNDANLVMNNLFYNVRDTAIQVEYGVTPTGNKIYNNTICNVIATGGVSIGIKVAADQSNADVKNNAVHLATTPFSNLGTGTTNTTNWFNPSQGNPLFINACSNLHLQTTSGLIDAGTNLSGTSTVDYAGTTRAGTWDIGAYDFSTVTPLHLEFTAHPSNVVEDLIMGPLVKACIYDTTQTLQTSNVTAISLAITANPASGTLTGGAGGAATNGCREFPGLSIDNVGTPYVLTASATAITSIASQPFAVTVAGSETSLRSLNMMHRP